MKRSIKLAVILWVGVLILTGCQRSASKAPEAVPEVIDTQATLLPVDQQIINATMTAQSIMQDFNQPTQIIQNSQGTQVVITQMPPTPIPPGTPTPTAAPALPEMTRPLTWTVQSGETIYCLARRFDVDPSDILSLNNYPNILFPGDVLDIPQSGEWPGGERGILTHPDVWNVSPGETVYGIACEYGDVWPEEIIAYNGLKEPYDLSGIDTLQIP